MIDWRFAAIKIVNVFAYRARIRFNMQQYMFFIAWSGNLCGKLNWLLVPRKQVNFRANWNIKSLESGFELDSNHCKVINQLEVVKSCLLQ